MGVGSGVGGMLGTAAGAYFGPGGMAIGSAVGSTAGSLFDMFKEKTSDEIKQSSSSAMADLNAQRNLREANAQEGMSTGQYQRQQDAANRDLLANNRTLNALTDNTGMGSLAREQLSKGLIKSFINAQQKLRDRQLENDIRQEQQNLTNKMKATEQVMRTGQIEDARQAKILAREDQRKALFAKSIQGAMKAAAAGAAYGKEKGWGQFTKDREKAAAANAYEAKPGDPDYMKKPDGSFLDRRPGDTTTVDITTGETTTTPAGSYVDPFKTKIDTSQESQSTGTPTEGIAGALGNMPNGQTPAEVLNGKTVTPEQVASNPEAVAKVAETDPDAAAKMISSSTVAQLAQTYGSFNGMPESFGLGPDLGFGMSLDTPDLDPELNTGLNLTLGEGYMYSGANDTGSKVQPIPPETSPATPGSEAAPALPEDPKEIKSADPTISAGDAEVKAVGNSLYNDIAGTTDEAPEATDEPPVTAGTGTKGERGDMGDYGTANPFPKGLHISSKGPANTDNGSVSAEKPGDQLQTKDKSPDKPEQIEGVGGNGGPGRPQLNSASGSMRRLDSSEIAVFDEIVNYSKRSHDQLFEILAKSDKVTAHEYEYILDRFNKGKVSAKDMVELLRDTSLTNGDIRSIIKTIGEGNTKEVLDNRGKPKPKDQKEEVATEDAPQKEDTSLKDAIEVERKKLRDSKTDTDSNTNVADVANNIVLRDVAEGKDAPKNFRVNGYDYNQSASDGTKYYKYFRDKGVDLQRIHDDDYLLYLQEEGIIGEGDLEKLDDWFLASEEAKQKGDR